MEVDGGQHAHNLRDRVRDSWLRARGYEVLRVWNNDVLKNTAGVAHCQPRIVIARSGRAPSRAA